MIIFAGFLVFSCFGLVLTGIFLLAGLAYGLIASGLAAGILAAIILRGVGRGRT